MDLADEIRVYRTLDSLQASRDFRELRAMNGDRAGNSQAGMLLRYHSRIEPVRPSRSHHPAPQSHHSAQKARR